MGDSQDEFNPRVYQVDLYEKAVKSNAIIYLPTGSGKTYIAVMLIKKLSNTVRKPYNEGGKRTIFAVNTVALVQQQCDYIKRHTDLMCGEYSGDMKVDFWTRETWLQQLEEFQVLVMTSQIFLNILDHGYIQLNRINLMIFDECHRAVNDHPMRQIMQRFEYCTKEDQPRVLALSATLLNSNMREEKVEETIRALEVTFHGKVAAVESIDIVDGYSTNPSEKIVLFEPPSQCYVLGEIIEMLEDSKAILKLVSLSNEMDNLSSDVFKGKSKNDNLKNILDDIKEHLLSMGLYGGSKAILQYMVQLECLKKHSDDTQTIYVVGHLITQLIKARKLLEDAMQGYTELERIHKFSSDQILKLCTVLKEFNEKKNNDQKFCCIIFVQRRYTAKVLSLILKSLQEVDSRYKFLMADFIVGFSNNPYKNIRESMCIAKWNKNALERFRNGFSNCMIATDVIDEGLNIPTCTLIIRYSVPLDFRSYVQSKGRARHPTSWYVILLSRDDNQFNGKYVNYIHVEQHLREVLIGKSDLRIEPTSAQVKTKLYNTKLEPLVVVNENNERSVVTETSAISLVNKYCTSLHNSKFVTLAPTWKLYKRGQTGDGSLYQVSLQMPVVSPLRDTVYGEFMSSIKDAKRAAALSCCKKLHEIGELTDNLLPRSDMTTLKNLDYLFPQWVDEKKVENGMPGTYSKKRQYNLMHPEPLYSAFPKANVKLYLHIIDIKPTYSVPHDNRRLVFYNLLNDNAGFAILSTKQMPKIAKFPIFMNVGELLVDMKMNHATLELSDKEIVKLKIFHSMIFNQVINVIKDFMVFDSSNLDNSFLVVPINEMWNINWEVINNYQHISYVQPTTPLIITSKNYDLALVRPSYRGSPSVYIVTQVCDDLMAESSFPTDDFHSYVHYFAERHGLHIQNGKQPMLEVKPISTKINCIKPRSMKPGLSKRKRADLLEDFEEHLVPELCHRVNFPALYWLKATNLPSILHRISQLLTAEELRVQIFKEAKLGVIQLSPGEEWNPLVIVEKEREEVVDGLMEHGFDEVMPESSQPQPELPGPEIDVLSSESEHYPWAREHEPPDLERGAEQIQLIDIEYYYQFMTATSESGEEFSKNRSKGGYMSKLNVQVPSLQALSNHDPKGPSPVDIMQALTSKLGNDAFDLERLETLGDSFLKFAISLYLFEAFESFQEGQLTTVKGKLLGNRNLYYCGKSKNIPGRMKIDDFVPNSNFIAPAYTAHRHLQKVLLDAEVSPNILYELSIPPEERLTGKLTTTTMTRIQEVVLAWNETEAQSGMEHFLGIQTVADKVVADSVEALIGVYLHKMGIKCAAKLLMWFGILPKNTSISDVLFGAPKDPCIGHGDPDSHVPWAESIEKRLGYKFKNRAFLLQALTHPSYNLNTLTPCYQRLEFLGDAILDFLITIYIYESCGELSPGALTDLRSALVNNITFACLAVRHGLHTALLAYSPQLSEIIDKFVKFQEERNHAIDDELLWVLLEEEECNIAQYVDVPKILGDLFESVTGAIYLDSGKNLSVVWELVYSLMHKEIDAFSKNVPKQPVRVIYETQGARPRFATATVIEGTNTVMVPLEVMVSGKKKLFHGFGGNKKQAKCAAAKQALKYLRCKK